MPEDYQQRTPSVDSRQYAIPEEAFYSQGSDSDDNAASNSEESDNSNDESIFPTESSGTQWMNQIQDTPMFDASNFLFESLNGTINNVDFSEALALQTKTSALINSKSRELKSLIQELQGRIAHYQGRFQRGVLVSNGLKENLRAISKRVELLDEAMAREHPIEYNQAKDKVMERTLSD